MKIDVDKFVESLIKRYHEMHNIDSTTTKCWLADILEDQGLKYEDGKIANPSEPDLIGMKELGKVWDEKQDPILQRLDRIYDLLLHKMNEKIIINNPFPRLTETPYKPGEVWCGSSAATSEKGGEE